MSWEICQVFFVLPLVGCYDTEWLPTFSFLTMTWQLCPLFYFFLSQIPNTRVFDAYSFVSVSKKANAFGSPVDL
jgi:hypothetical protein